MITNFLHQGSLKKMCKCVYVWFQPTSALLQLKQEMLRRIQFVKGFRNALSTATQLHTQDIFIILQTFTQHDH